jgi:hypothetical protein
MNKALERVTRWRDLLAVLTLRAYDPTNIAMFVSWAMFAAGMVTMVCTVHSSHDYLFLIGFVVAVIGLIGALMWNLFWMAVLTLSGAVSFARRSITVTIASIRWFKPSRQD